MLELCKLFQRSHKEKSDRTVYTCKLCPRTFLSNTGRWLHIKLNHGDPIKYSCQSCDFQTVYKYRVKSHFTTVHIGGKQHECYFCKRKLSTFANFIRHFQLHTGEKYNIML